MAGSGALHSVTTGCSPGVRSPDAQRLPCTLACTLCPCTVVVDHRGMQIRNPLVTKLHELQTHLQRYAGELPCALAL